MQFFEGQFEVEKIVAETWSCGETVYVVTYKSYGSDYNQLQSSKELKRAWRRNLNKVEKGSGTGPDVQFDLINDWEEFRDNQAYMPQQETFMAGEFVKHGFMFKAFLIG
jgi:hypothetical protein